MTTWEEYKKHVKETDNEIGKDVESMEILAGIIGAVIKQRHDLNLSQRDLASACGLPHSSIARIESGRNVPNLTTLLKIVKALNLEVRVSQVDNFPA